MARIRQAKHVIGEWWGEMGFQTCFSPHFFEPALPCIDLSPDQQHYSTQLQWGYIEDISGSALRYSRTLSGT